MARHSLTVCMMSRITLHLRSYANNPNKVVIIDNASHQPRIQLPRPHQTFLSTVSQPGMTFAPPSSPPPPPAAFPSIHAPQQPRVQRVPPTPRDYARATAASSLSSLESGSYAMDTLSSVAEAAVLAEEFPHDTLV